MMRRRRVLLAVAAAGLLAVPGLRATGVLAAWINPAPLQAAVGTLSSCSAATSFGAIGQARPLAGSIGGAALSGAALGALTATATATGVTGTSGATALGGGAFGGQVPGGTGAAAVAAAAGASVLAAPATNWNAVASAATTGVSTAGSGGVNPATGAVPASGGTPFGTLDISALLGAAAGTALPGVTGVQLAIGPAAARATLDGCAAAWSTGSPLTRSYRLGALTLGLADASATGLLATDGTQSDAVSGAITTATGGSATSAAESAVASAGGSDLAIALGHALTASGVLSPIVQVTSATAVVDVPSAQLAAIRAALSETVTDSSGLVTLDASTGRITVDFTAGPGIDARGANAALLPTAQGTAIATALQAVLAAHDADVQSAWSAARAAMTVRVQALATATAAGLPVASAAVDVTATAGAWAAHTERVAPTVTALGSTGGTLLSAVTSALTSGAAADLWAPLEPVVSAQAATPVASAVTAAIAAVTAAETPAAPAAGVEVQRLPGVLSLTADERPDAAPAPPAYPGALANAVTALRVTVTAGGSTLADLFVANASVGPNRSFAGS